MQPARQIISAQDLGRNKQARVSERMHALPRPAISADLASTFTGPLAVVCTGRYFLLPVPASTVQPVPHEPDSETGEFATPPGAGAGSRGKARGAGFRRVRSLGFRESSPLARNFAERKGPTNIVMLNCLINCNV